MNPWTDLPQILIGECMRTTEMFLAFMVQVEKDDLKGKK